MLWWTKPRSQLLLWPTQAWQGGSPISYIPHRFSSTSKAQLRCSDVDSDLLFDLASVEKAIGQAQQALTEEVTTLFNKDAVEETPHTPRFYSGLFVVPKVTGGFRLIIYLSFLN
ncbi:hypothetical protein E2C01_050808 [Portunus trituberculatus]|uniref:Uncharacterized protein n=1 Tax=Portunus trituberculatus TaxID=210409 RepID=A0A5B7GD34_PORTR|nr:hypothetical protein [Portunus trituberculatus]